jgi:hypothetical protein
VGSLAVLLIQGGVLGGLAGVSGVRGVSGVSGVSAGRSQGFRGRSAPDSGSRVPPGWSSFTLMLCPHLA